MQGLLLHAIVHSAGVQDRDGGIWLLATLFGQFPFLAKLFADSAYAGSIFHTALGKVLPNLKTEIVRRSDRAKGFVPLPKRWIVERTLAWLNRCRRLAKDWENLNRRKPISNYVTPLGRQQEKLQPNATAAFGSAGLTGCEVGRRSKHRRRRLNLPAFFAEPHCVQRRAPD